MTNLTDAFRLAAEAWPERVRVLPGMDMESFFQVFDDRGGLVVTAFWDDGTEELDAFLSSLPVPVEAWADKVFGEWYGVTALNGEGEYMREAYPTKREAYLAAVDSAIRWAVDEWKRRNP